MAELFTRGRPIDWPAVIGPAPRVSLPTYAFQHQRYWLMPSTPTSNGAHGLSAGSVELQHVTLDDGPSPKESLVQRLKGLSEVDQERILLDLVRTHTAIVLGHPAGETIEALRAFKDMGFDSLTVVALRNHIAAATGIDLPVTVLFDYPTPTALSQLLRDKLRSGPAATPASVFIELDNLEKTLLDIPEDDPSRASITARLQRIISMWRDAERIEGSDMASQIQAATTSEVLDFIDQQLGRAVR
jgi:acyl transferase domain-containing protein